MKKSRTFEERFILKIFELSQAAGDTYTVLDSAVLEKAMGITDKKARNIINQLAQANFIRKKSKTEFHLSQQGISLVERLLESEDS